MAANHNRALSIRALVLALLFVMTLASGAQADRSPAGLVDDRADQFSAEQLAQLDAQLSGKSFRYQVLILPSAFAEENPPNEEARFRELATELMSTLGVERDGVLITIAMRERLVDFRAWGDGPVNQAFRQATGQEFSAFNSLFLNRFSGPAREGDIVGGILAAVTKMEELTATSPAPQASSPEAKVPASLWWWLLGLLGVGLGARQTVQLARYRRRLRESLSVRDAFLEQLLDLTERKLPLARNFSGEETRKLTTAAIAESERSLHAHRDGDQRLQEAERLARQMRFGAAQRLLGEVQLAFNAAAASCQSACKAYAPIGDAIHEWDDLLAQSHVAREQVRAGLESARRETGWPLPLLEQRLVAGAGQVANAEQLRLEDPVLATQHLQTGLTALRSAQAEVAVLPELQAAYQALQTLRNQGQSEVDGGRQTLGLRYVERDPEEHLARAAQLDREMARLMPEGDVPAARQAHQAAEEAVRTAISIVAAYRQAVAEISVKTAQLAGQVESLPPDIATAERVAAELSARFAVDDWQDLAQLSSDLTSLQERIRQGLLDVDQLARPAEQRYLTAASLLNDLLAEREQARQNLQRLTERPGLLDATARSADERLRQAQNDWQAGLRRIEREDLRLQSDSHAEAATVEQQIREAEGVGSRRPLPARHWEQVAGEAARLAASFRQAIDELARQAGDARERLNQAMAQSGRATRYESYDGSQAARMRSALTNAHQAMAEGYYGEVIAQADMALRAMHALEAAYRAYEAEQERIRREEQHRREERQRQSSGGGGNWGSGNKTSGGSKTSGGGGSWGSDGNKTSGGGGKW